VLRRSRPLRDSLRRRCGGATRSSIGPLRLALPQSCVGGPRANSGDSSGAPRGNRRAKRREPQNGVNACDAAHLTTQILAFCASSSITRTSSQQDAWRPHNAYRSTASGLLRRRRALSWREAPEGFNGHGFHNSRARQLRRLVLPQAVKSLANISSGRRPSVPIESQPLGMLASAERASGAQRS
jgi:hypothetical protein